MGMHVQPAPRNQNNPDNRAAVPTLGMGPAWRNWVKKWLGVWKSVVNFLPDLQFGNPPTNAHVFAWPCSFRMTSEIETALIQELLYICWVRVRFVEIAIGSSNTDLIASNFVKCFEVAMTRSTQCQLPRMCLGEIPARPNVRLLTVRSAASWSCTCIVGAAPTMQMVPMS